MKKAIHIGTITLIASILTLGLWLITRSSIGIGVNEFFIYQKNPLPSSDKIVIVRVDNESLDALQKTDLRIFNLSKTVFSTLINKLEAMSVRAIGIDIIFTNRSEDENILADTLRDHPNVVIWARVGIGADSEEVLPRSVFSGATWGMINIERYGKLASRVIPSQSLSGSSIETMSIALYRKYLSDTSPISASSSDNYTINPLKRVPLKDGRILIPFFHLPRWYPSYSLIDILEDRIPASVFQDKIVLVGEYGTLIHDEFLSPIDPYNPMPWVEFHANMLDGLITGRFLEERDTFFFAWLLIFISSAVFFLLRFTWHIVYSIITSLALIVICHSIFTDTGWIYDFYLLALGLAVTFIVAIIYRYFTTSRERRFIESAFSHYLSPEVVRKISENPTLLKLGGEKREITVIFTDIAGFTTISERLSMEQLFSMMSEYLSEMTDILTEHEGTLDKYIGDAVMGFFWAPIHMDDGHLRACATALSMQKRLQELMEKWIWEGIPAFSVRIGIHTWEAIVGNIGSHQRFNYTVMGDTVNLASRLEWVNKEYCTLICVSQAVYKDTHDIYDFRELDTIRVKWKNKGVKIYELLGLIWEKSTIHDTYEKWLSLYYKWKYLEAMEILESIATTDSPARVIIERCESLLEQDIELEDGIWTMQTK